MFRLKTGIFFAIFVFIFVMTWTIPAHAQINDLSETEQANVELVLKNIESLLNSFTKYPPEYDEILENLKNKLKNGDIKSVPGLDDDKNKKYKEDGAKKGSPKAAYCHKDTYIKDGKKWVKCKKGTIIVDSGILDPNNGTPIDESTFDGWTQKWELLHILVHEKAHELIIEEQIELVKNARNWIWKTDKQKEICIKKAEEKGSSARAHGTAFDFQKNILKAKVKELNKEKKQTTDKDEKEEIKNKIKWLEERIKKLEKDKKKVTRSARFAFEGCGWPHNFTTGNVTMVITYPGGYERHDFVLIDGWVFDMWISETKFFDYYEVIEPPIENPSIYITMSNIIFAATDIQPEPCKFIQWSLEDGNIQVSSERPDSLVHVPPWLQQNLIWWKEGLIGDADISSTIQYMLKKQLIKGIEFIPTDLPSMTKGDKVIPSSVKTKFDLWAENVISDENLAESIRWFTTKPVEIPFGDG